MLLALLFPRHADAAYACLLYWTWLAIYAALERTFEFLILHCLDLLDTGQRGLKKMKFHFLDEDRNPRYLVSSKMNIFKVLYDYRKWRKKDFQKSYRLLKDISKF